jgi:hypothetical protein
MSAELNLRATCTSRDLSCDINTAKLDHKQYALYPTQIGPRDHFPLAATVILLAEIYS